MSKKITTNLWFDTQAKEAADFYLKTFKDSEKIVENTLHNTPSGDVDVVTIRIFDHELEMMSAGPLFKVNPSVSFLIACETKEEVDELWSALSEGGSALMELGKYPFSDWYGWTADKYGVSWQVMLIGDMKPDQKVTPTLMFVGDQAGNAEEAVTLYTSVFKNSKIEHVDRYNKGEEPDKEGTVRHMGYKLEGQGFAAMDSAQDHKFSFNEAISFAVHCDDQKEIDYFWEKLSADPKSEECGWLKDKYGVSWQIVPKVLAKMLVDSDQTKVEKVTKAFLEMKKFNIEDLEKAYNS